MTFQSDPTLLAEIRKYGKFDTNACLQCGSCTVACDLTYADVAFPRRTFRYALLGLREPLLRSLDPWLCTYCGDCTETCPRQTEPAEAMMTLRRYLIAQYDWTGLAAKIFTSKVWHLGALAFVGVLVLALALFYHLYVGLELADLVAFPMGLEHMFDIIEIFTIVVFVIPLVILLGNGCRMYWYTMRAGCEERYSFRYYLRQAKALITEAVAQLRFRECTDKWPWIVHFPLVPATVLMSIILVFFLDWFQTDNLYPIYHPQRWLGYLATAALFFGTSCILLGRIQRRRLIHKFSELADWTFPILLFLTTLSGILVHIFRYLGLELTTHYTYAIHLAIAVPMLVVLLPVGKWSHVFYRPIAFYLQKVKEEAPAVEVPKEAIADHAA